MCRSFGFQGCMNYSNACFWDNYNGMCYSR
jgi:hypothetical protein